MPEKVPLLSSWQYKLNSAGKEKRRKVSQLIGKEWESVEGGNGRSCWGVGQNTLYEGLKEQNYCLKKKNLKKGAREKVG